MEAANPAEADTFAAYLAKYYLVNKGYNALLPPEAAELTSACDFVVCRHDGMTFEIVCFVDREARPGERFGLSPDDTRDIARNCLKYAGKMGVSQMPASIRVVEVGPGINIFEEQRRLQAFQRETTFSRAGVTAWLVDTSSKTVWTNAPPLARWLARYSPLHRLLRKPRVAMADSGNFESRPSADAAVAGSDVAYVTYALLVVLAAVFAAECVFAIGPLKGALQPSITTLGALGGLYWPRVVESGEWYRLLSATFLHADLMHLALNAFVLFYAGRRLEWIIGHSWFAAIYFISAVCGSIVSLALNPANVVGIGASGAIMGVLAASFIASFHFALGATRTRLQMTALQVLIPSLLPIWLTSRNGMLVDFGAHLGGAVGGTLVAGLLLAIWPRSSPMPRLRYIALASAGLLGSLAALIPISGSYATFQQEEALQARLIPSSQFPDTIAAGRAEADSLITRYPEDPRGYLFRGMNALDAHDYARAIADL
jgi:rhomboid protease GluP